MNQDQTASDSVPQTEKVDTEDKTLSGPLFADSDATELADYRPLSLLAVAAAFAGIAASLANFQKVLFVIPIAGVVLSLLAIRDTNPDSTRIGRKLALFGLGASILFGSFAFTRAAVERYVLINQAAEVAKGWTDIVRSGNLPQACEWMKLPGGRRQASVDLAEFYVKNEDAETYMKNVGSYPSIRRLLKINEDQEVKFLGLEDSVREHNVTIFKFLFELPPIKGETNNEFIISVRRTFRHGRVEWVLQGADMKQLDEK